MPVCGAPGSLLVHEREVRLERLRELGRHRPERARLDAVLREIWDKIARRRRDAAVEREVERERMSPEERRMTGESVDGLEADEFVGEVLGGTQPGQLRGEDEPQRT